MATYDLKYPGAAIDAILDTAYHLQQAGYIFRGSASDYSGTPTEREWVIAPAGFTGLGLSSAVPQGSIGICLYNGTAWVGKVINVLTLDSAPTRNSQNGVTSGGVAATLDEIAGGIMETFASLLFDDETAAADLRSKLSYAVKFSVSDVYQTVTHLNILAATTSKAGLMSAEDKAKVDSFLTNLRSLTFADTTASADQGTKITETLKATIGGVQEVIDSITLLAATSSKAGLLSAADKAYIDALPATLTSLSNSISGALALMQSMMGYYVCDTAAGTAAKTVAATGYSLTNGGCIRIKMTNANTANNVTLNINSTGAKALYYDGSQASASNTWEAGEVLEVYYDGTQYQCASGGSVSADRVSYDNTESGITAENVQEAIDLYAEALDNCFVSSGGITENIPITQSQLQNGGHEWTSNPSRIVTKRDDLIPTNNLTSVGVHIPYSAVSGTNIDRVGIIFYTFDKRHISTLDKPWVMFNGADVNITLDITGSDYQNAKYFGLYLGSAGSAISVSSFTTTDVYFIVVHSAVSVSPAVTEAMLNPITQELTEHQTILSGCYHTRNINPTVLPISQDDLVNGNNSWQSNSKRIVLKQEALLSVDGKAYVRMEIPYSAITDTNINRVAIAFYNSNKSYMSTPDLGWFYFNGQSVVIEAQLSDSEYENVKYISPYFGSEYNISPSSIVASSIVVTVYDGEVYTTQAIDSDYLKLKESFDFTKIITTTNYLGERISVAKQLTYQLYSYSYEQIGTLSSGYGARQGAVVYGKYLFQFHVNLGNIIVFNLETRQNVQTIGSLNIGTFHANDGGFSARFYDPSDTFPLLYISGEESHTVKVFRITGTEGNFVFTLIQTITIASEWYYQNATVDAVNNRLVCFGYTKNSWTDSANNNSIFFSVDIPDIDEDLTIQPSSFQNIFTVPFIYAHQGAFAVANKVYICFGNTNSNIGIIVLDYFNGTILSYACLKVLGNTEPEGLGYYDGKLVLTLYNGNVYLITT